MPTAIEAADRGALLRAAIWAAPDNVDVYRVYADWLLEQGDSLGEYMQLALLTAPAEEQKRRATALLKKHRAAWLGAARPFVRSWTNDARGLVATAVCEAQKLSDGFAHLLQIGPRLRLTVTSFAKRRRATVAEVGRLSLGSFHALALSSDLDDRDLEVLAPALVGIRHLDLGYNSFTAAGLRTLGAYVAGIRTLAVISHNFSPDWIDALVETSGFESLECVEVHGHDLRSQVPGEEQLVRLRAMPAMRRVNPPRATGAPTIAMDPSEP
jgi:uncharacterized protein (TIGR02996 family)